MGRSRVSFGARSYTDWRTGAGCMGLGHMQRLHAIPHELQLSIEVKTTLNTVRQRNRPSTATVIDWARHTGPTTSALTAPARRLLWGDGARRRRDRV